MIDIDTLIKSPHLFRTQFPNGWLFEWRPLTIKEYRVYYALRASGTIHPYAIYKLVFDRCYIGDPELVSKNMPLFMPMTVGSLIMYVSGDCNTETIRSEIHAARNDYASDDITEIMKRTISAAFPTESYFDLESISRLELIDKFVKAEAHLNFTSSGQYVPLDLNKIVSSTEGSAIEEKMQFVDFDSDNQGILQNLNLEEREQVEAGQLATNKITPQQAKKLDALKYRK
jgi:hypothetical protein